MSRPGSEDGHERFESDAAAYALGALEVHEVRLFEEHLAGCKRCQADLAAMREAVEALPAAAVTAAAAPELKQRVMADVRADAELQASGARTGRRPRTRPTGSRARWPVPVLGATAAAAIAAVLVALSPGGGSSARTYAGVVYAPDARASVRVSGSTATLSFARLPAPPARRIYQVWLKRGGQPPRPTQALFSTTTGSVTVAGNLRGVQAVLVTAEPRPYGSRAPTRAPLIVVGLRRA